MADFDVIVIGGGPAGYTAALKAAERGATVALVEAERPGGACVHHACIPTNAMLSAMDGFIAARELDAVGVLQAGEQFNFGRAVARKETLVRLIAGNIEAALRLRRVQVIRARAAFASANRVTLTGDDRGEVNGEAIVIATGTRWEPPALPGVPPDRVLTVDQVHSMQTPPASALVLGGGPADTAFALEYAFLLAAAGSEVTIATPFARLVPALDAALTELAAAVLANVGVNILTEASIEGSTGETVTVRHAGGTAAITAEVVVAADPRRPFFETLNLQAAGVHADGCIAVDAGCRTNVATIFAAGDVTGGAMLTSAALQMGEVAGENATVGEARARLGRLPHLLHTVPEIGWIGLTEEAARSQGYDVRIGVSDLAYNARAITLGARQGLVKVVAEREMGEILGVHAIGPSASEVLAAAAVALQAEVSLDDLAATAHWHPSVGESLAEAARRAR